MCGDGVTQFSVRGRSSTSLGTAQSNSGISWYRVEMAPSICTASERTVSAGRGSTVKSASAINLHFPVMQFCISLIVSDPAQTCLCPSVILYFAECSTSRERVGSSRRQCGEQQRPTRLYISTGCLRLLDPVEGVGRKQCTKRLRVGGSRSTGDERCQYQKKGLQCEHKRLSRQEKSGVNTTTTAQTA